MEGEKGLQGRMAVTTRREKVTEKVLLLELGQQNQKEPSGSRSVGESGISRRSLGRASPML